MYGNNNITDPTQLKAFKSTFTCKKDPDMYLGLFLSEGLLEALRISQAKFRFNIRNHSQKDNRNHNHVHIHTHNHTENHRPNYSRDETTGQPATGAGMAADGECGPTEGALSRRSRDREC